VGAFNACLNNMKIDKELTVYQVKVIDEKIKVIDYGKVSAGFPSPAEDFVDRKLSLDDRYLQHPESTFIVIVGGLSMANEYDLDDVLVIRSDLTPHHNDDVIVSVNNSDYTLKRFDFKQNKLIALNPSYNDSIQLNADDEVKIMGVVTVQIKERRKV
jgi:DNA polymerase V